MASFQSFVQNNPTPPPQPGFFAKNIVNPIKNAFSSGVNEVKQGYETSKQGAESGNVFDLVGGATHIVTGIGGAVASPLAPVLQRPIGAAVGGVSDAISNSPAVQSFANSGAGKVASGIAGTVAQGANLVGTVGGGMAGAEQIHGLATDHPIFKSSTDLTSAEGDLNTASRQGVNAQKLMNTQAQVFNQGLGENFKNAGMQLQQTNPGLKMELPSDAVDALAEIKATKNFALPEDLLQTIPDINKVENGSQLSLNPTDTQELIRQLNKATFSTKASGDLVVNQKLINLTNSIKNSAKEAFGTVTDAQGNSVWNKAYSDYATGKTALEKINDLVDVNSKSTSSDIQKTMNNITKLSKDPAGKIILQDTINEFKQTSGIDFTDPVKDIQTIMQKSDIYNELAKEAEKGTALQQFVKGATDPKYLGKRLVEGAVISILAYGWLRKLAKEAGITP